jgi:hypothetical protein
MGSRFSKPTTRGYVVFGWLGISVVAIVFGVIVGGGAGTTICAIGGVSLAFLAFVLFPSSIPRKRQRFSDDEEYVEPRRSAGR